MQIVSPTYYTGKGKRSINQDFVFPENPAEDCKVFMVCDGVGGEKCGEIASKLTGLTIYDQLRSNAENDRTSIKHSIEQAHQMVQKFSERFPDTNGMASTVALLHHAGEAYYAAWVGDSRIYQIRDGEIIFKSKDHSYWQWMEERGMLDEPGAEERNKAFKNMILQAIGGKNTVRPGIVKISDVKQGDYFLLLTDGILEAHDEDSLMAPFISNKNNEEILQEIISLCHEKSNDNYSTYILKIDV